MPQAYADVGWMQLKLVCIIDVASAASGLARITSAERFPSFLGACVIVARMLSRWVEMQVRCMQHWLL